VSVPAIAESGDDLANRRVVAVAFCILAAVACVTPIVNGAATIRIGISAAISGPLFGGLSILGSRSLLSFRTLRRTRHAPPDSVTTFLLQRRTVGANPAFATAAAGRDSQTVRADAADDEQGRK